VNVLQVSISDRGGGGEAVALGLHRELRRRGHEAWLAVGRRRADEEGVLAIGAERSGGRPRLARAARALRDPRVALDFVRGREDFRFPASRRVLELPPHRPDVLHLHNLHGAYFDLRALPGLAARQPTAWTLHDEWAYTGHCAYTLDSEQWLTGCGSCPRLRVYPALAVDGTASNWRRKRELWARATLHVVTPSSWLLERVRRSILAPAAATERVIPNGVDVGLFAPGDRAEARRKLGISGDAHVLVFTAQATRANLYKDFETLREALSRLDGVKPTVAFALGENAPPERLGQIELRSAEASRDGVAEHLRAADLYVHATRADNHPLAVLEALACGVPAVASRVGGIPEQLRAETGVLVEPGVAEALAAAIAGLLADPARRARMSEAAAADARARFSLERQADAYVDLYAELAEPGC
jgi:glycosyltransferase involved in cell wall biosynthesis